MSSRQVGWSAGTIGRTTPPPPLPPAAGQPPAAGPPFTSTVYRGRWRTRRSNRVAFATIAAGAGGLITAAIVVLGGCSSSRPAAATVPAGIVPPATASPAAAVHPARHAAAATSVPAGQPVRLRLTALGINATVVPVGVSAAGELAVPNNPQVLGWWYQGGTPGGARGRVVIDGHVDSAASGAGAFFHLRQAPLGTAVDVTTAHGTLRYRVAARRAYDKDSLPADVFATGGPSQLVLITCGGTFDTATHHYTDNVVVYATPSAT